MLSFILTIFSIYYVFDIVSIQSFRKLAISTIRNMVIKVESADIFLFYLCGRGISKVEIVGIVRSVQTRQKKVVYHIDDGTGSMRCVKFFNTSDATSYSAFLPGDMVAVKGILVMSETNEEDYGFCIHLSCMEIVDDPNMETFHWLSCIDLFQSEYSHGTS